MQSGNVSTGSVKEILTIICFFADSLTLIVWQPDSPSFCPIRNSFGSAQDRHPDHNCAGLQVPHRQDDGHEFPSAPKYSVTVGVGLCKRRLENHIPLRPEPQFPFP